MCVIDGLCMGHRLCAMPRCPNEPEDFRSRKLCTKHAAERSGLCGIVACMKKAQKNSGACRSKTHQSLWKTFQQVHTRGSYGNHKRVQRREHGEARRGGSHKKEEWEVSGAKMKSSVANPADDPEQTIPHHRQDPATSTTQSETTPNPRTANLWQFRHLYCIETISRPCGCIVAWSKFPTSEGPSAIVDMVEGTFSEEDRPAYIVIDKACRIVDMLQGKKELRGPGAWEKWCETSRWKVDIFHWFNHKNDPICEEWCNPSPNPLDDPNLRLIIEGIDDDETHYQNAFNTESAEQLNAWFGRYATQLEHMNAVKHDFLIHVMLTYRFKSKVSKQ